MLIDWFTVGAQTLNFVVLVWLMKRFLYKPILDAIDARETRIAAELADAAATKAQAHEERDSFQKKNAAFEQQRSALLLAATEAAKAEEQRLTDLARTAVEALRAKQQEALRADARDLYQAIGRNTQQEVFSIARKALAELASVSLESRMTVVFLERVKGLDAAAQAALAKALQKDAQPLIRSAFALPEPQREAIRTALNAEFSIDVTLRFETAAELVSGIELSAGGQKVGWTITDYLAVMEKDAARLLQEHRQAVAPATPATPAAAAPPSPVPAPASASAAKANDDGR